MTPSQISALRAAALTLAQVDRHLQLLADTYRRPPLFADDIPPLSQEQVLALDCVSGHIFGAIKLLNGTAGPLNP